MRGDAIFLLDAIRAYAQTDHIALINRKEQLTYRAKEYSDSFAAYLPSYMIPRKFIAVSTFPLGVSGKVDKKALAARLKGDGL